MFWRQRTEVTAVQVRTAGVPPAWQGTARGVDGLPQRAAGTAQHPPRAQQPRLRRRAQPVRRCARKPPNMIHLGSTVFACQTLKE